MSNDNNSNNTSLKEKTAKGLMWSGLNNLVQQVLGLVFGIILGRLLSPDDYGMIAMITIFSAIAIALQDSGFGSAIIKKEEVSHADLNSVFWVNTLLSLVFYAVLFFCAPLIAAYYHTPELTALCRYAFLSFIIVSVGNVPSAYLIRSLRIKQKAKSGMVGVVVSSCVGVIMAWQGFGYWTLATQNIVYVLTNTLLMWHYCSWRPTLNIDFRPAMAMFGFSSKILITTIVNHVNTNILNILLGRYFSANDTGKYNQAYQWNHKATLVVQGMISQVSYPVLSGLANEPERQLAALRKMVRFAAFLAFPLLLGFGMVAHEFILITITAKWEASARLLSILTICGAVEPVALLLQNLLLSKGRSDTYMWSHIAFCLAQLVMLRCLWPYGITVMVIAYTSLFVLWVLVWHTLAHRLLPYSLVHFLADTVPFALAAVGVMGATWLMTSPIANLHLLLISRIVLAALLYYGVMRMARVQILDECMAFLLRKLRIKS